MKTLGRYVMGLLLTLFLSHAAWGQGLLVTNHPSRLPRPIIHPRRPLPPPPTSYAIKELSVQARIVDQVARVQVSQTFVNTGSRQMEVSFVFPLPHDGAIDQLTLMVDGKEFAGKILPAKEARSIYEGYVRRNKDPALLEWLGTGMFKTSVFPVPAGASRKVTMHYSQLLRKDHQLTDFLFPLSTAKYTSHPVEKLTIDATIESTQSMKSVYSPTHGIKIKRPDENHAVVSYESENEIPSNDFRLFFDVAKTKLGASLLTYRPQADEDGYFLLLASPNVKIKKAERVAKTTILVLDRSGSMSGKKMDQAKEALKFVLNNLREGDLFNVVAYDSTVETFRPELQRYDEQTRKAALGFVEGLYAGGSTNIEGALHSALDMIQDDSRPNYVVFLTDGRPTAGETNELKIVAAAKSHNKLNSRIISFGVGYDVNSRLLDRLSRQNHGQSEYVRPDEDIEAHVSRLYNRIDSPVLTNLVVKVDVDEVETEDGDPINRVYPREVTDLFAGEQLVLVGRYRKAGDAKVVIRGTLGKREQKFDFPASLVKHSKDASYGFVEKLWAMRRIGEIIDELDLKGKNDELVQELVGLSTRHGILTPYTSFLADENAKPSDLALGRRQLEMTRSRLERLDEVEGRAAFSQRSEKKAFQSADKVDLAQSSSGFARSFGSGSGGLGGGGRGAAPASAPGLAGAKTAQPRRAGIARYRDIESDRELSAGGVQSIGSETLYKRGKLWIAASARNVDLEKDKAKIEVVERFSTAYFALIKANTKAENSVLARQAEGEEMLVKLRGQVYLLK